VPAATSAAVTTVVVPARHVVDAPGARVVASQVTGVTAGSSTARPDSGTRPVFVAVTVQATVSPTSTRRSPSTSVAVPCFVSARPDGRAVFVTVQAIASPTPTGMLVEVPTPVPDGSAGSVAPLRVHDHEGAS